MSKGAIIAIVVAVCWVIGFCMQKCEEPKKKAEKERIESILRDKSNYTEQSLRWFELYGKSMGFDYNSADPVLIKINNLHIISFDAGTYDVGDGTQEWPVHIHFDNQNLSNDFKDLFYREAHFDAYCQIKAGMLYCTMIE
jgi:hypothetical protein